MRLCENTKKRTNRFWGPAMAATLVGGVGQPSEDGRRLELYIIRIGDGLVEHIETLDSVGGVSPLLSMDSEETEISASLCPGPLGQNALSNTEVIQPSIGVGEALLISSDGLTRGHSVPVFEKLREIIGNPQIGLRCGDQSSALTVLQKAADHADDAFNGNRDLKLFNDNVSLIVLVYDRTTGRFDDGKT